MKNATKFLIVYRTGEIIGFITIITGVTCLLKKLNSKLFNINFV
jgi:hypothetical protein